MIPNHFGRINLNKIKFYDCLSFIWIVLGLGNYFELLCHVVDVTNIGWLFFTYTCTYNFFFTTFFSTSRLWKKVVKWFAFLLPVFSSMLLYIKVVKKKLWSNLCSYSLYFLPRRFNFPNPKLLFFLFVFLFFLICWFTSSSYSYFPFLSLSST